MTIELWLKALLLVADCIRRKKEHGRIAQLRLDVQRFAKAVKERDGETVSRMLSGALHGISRSPR